MVLVRKNLRGRLLLNRLNAVDHPVPHEVVKSDVNGAVDLHESDACLFGLHQPHFRNLNREDLC